MIDFWRASSKEVRPFTPAENNSAVVITVYTCYTDTRYSWLNRLRGYRFQPGCKPGQWFVYEPDEYGRGWMPKKSIDYDPWTYITRLYGQHGPLKTKNNQTFDVGAARTSKCASVYVWL